MTPMTTPRPPDGHLRRLSRLRAIALALLLIAVPPAWLLLITGNPLNPPKTLRSTDALSQQIDDATVVYLVAVAIWLCWLHLLGCLLTQTLQQGRGSRIRMPLPRLLFGANALIASHLVAAILMSGSGTSFTPAPQKPATVATWQLDETAPRHAGLSTSTHRAATTPALPRMALAAVEAPSPPHAAPATAKSETGISCRVLPPHGQHYDTLWGIAERHLGDGLRWRDIYALNEGRLMPDGQRLTRASLIRPGWILQLPTDAVALPVDHVPPVHPTGPVGAPRLAEPGPSPRDAAPGRQQTKPPLRDAPAHPHAPSPTVATRPDSTPPADAAATGTAQHQETLPVTSPVTSPVTRQAQPSTPSTTSTDEHDTDVAVAAGLGTLLLGAAALLRSLNRRRKLAARRRPPGVRHTRPAADLVAAERDLRLAARTAEDITATLRLALLIAAQASPALRVQAVWEHPDGSLELVLFDHDPEAVAPSPFETTARGWRLTPEGQRYLFAIRVGGLRRRDRSARLDQQLQAAPDPFPLLLPVGAQDGSACLVNIEALGLIALDATAGPDLANRRDSASAPQPGDALQMIAAAWAQAVAGAPWAELTDLYVPQTWAPLVTGLATAHGHDFEPTSTEPSATAASLAELIAGPRPLPASHRERYAGATTLEAARRDGTGGADSLRVALSLGYRPEQIPAWLLNAAADPLDPNVLVLLGHTPAVPSAHRWTLAGDGTVTIPGIADRLIPLRLDKDEHERILRLLEHAEDPPHAAADDPDRAELLSQCPPAAPTSEAPVPLDPHDDLTRHVTDAGADADADADAAADADTDADANPVAEAGRGAEVEADAGADFGAGDGSQEPAEDHPVVHDPCGAERPAVIDLTTSNGSQPGSLEAPTPAATAPARSLTSGDHEGSTQPSSGVEALPPGPVEVRVLGPLEVSHAIGEVPRKQALDVLVHLALHRRPVPSEVLFEAVWPGSNYSSRTIRNRVSELRGYIAPGVDFARGGYQLPDLVQTDWQRFQALAQGDSDAQLAALQLVRGRPFEGSTLDWMHLEGQFAEMEAAIVDLALEVGERALRHRQYEVARTACAAGLRGCPYDERIYRLGMEAAAALGLTAEVRELRRRLDLILDEDVQDDIQPATEALYRRLNNEDELRARRHQRHA